VPAFFVPGFDQPIQLPHLRAEARGAVGDNKLLLGVRPENVVQTAREAGWPSVRARVELIEPTGADSLVLVRMGDHELLVRSEPGTCKVGEELSLAFSPAKMLLFDAESGRLVA
jgi:multiple sugar transport system ATP-binding protein